ncbi:MAG: bifunctional (p)ppGpp synthetase/guanosine-3',5'-bis(diphosphate) 3'-pyrophosphohydrolase [Thermocrinis sp.]|nr:bifunctional (p)ppGpp synthetase/guanosine-3',5'-bis(diphosphate) 3'-pyrophosphohydrolase [Thermocrinis sp.]
MQTVLSKKVEKLLSLVEEGDREDILKAIEFLEERHAGQKRASGEPYAVHPIETAIIVASMGLKKEAIISALLHDVLEDTNTTYQELKERFGETVANIVEGVTKIGKYKIKDVSSEKAENYRKLFLATAKDIRVLLVKLADRLHNMRTLEHLPKEKRIRIAKETLEIYVPLANRLGVWQIKTELEDLCFMHLYPKEYERVKEFVKEERAKLEEYLKRHFIPKLKEALKRANIQAEITYRPKHLFGIWQKTIRKGISLEDVHDILGVRVIVNTVEECYLVLGIIHNTFTPVPGKFDDYISLPKPNLYQSLHTAVIGPKGRVVEVQIRTWEMHERAEKGIAAHWAYKESVNIKDNSIYGWLKELVESLKGSKNAQEVLENIKLELFSEEVFVFTPKGDLLVLPKGATPVDFAYHIHTDIGNHCAGAKVNGRIVPLDYRLQNGDQVEIITNPNKKPNPEWLKFVVTSKAKSKIKAYLKELERERQIQEGRELLENLAKKLNIDRQELLEKIKKQEGIEKDEDVYLLAGSKKLTKERVYQLLGVKKPEVKEKDQSPQVRVRMEDIENVAYQLAKCCNPLPGDEVLGVVAKGKGLIIHLKGCPNLEHFLKHFPERVVHVDWENAQGKYPAIVRVWAKDRVGILGEVASTFAKHSANILQAITKSLKTGEAVMEFTLELSNAEHLKRVLQALRELEGVEKVSRVVRA